jgi:hypothetical protein
MYPELPADADTSATKQALKSGASMSDGLLSSDSGQWVKTPRSDDMAKRTRHHDVLPLGGAQHGVGSGKHHIRSDVRYSRKQ